MRQTLIDLIDRLDEVDDSDRFESPCIFAEGGPNAAPSSLALVCPIADSKTFVCPQDPRLSYVLEVQQAKECIDVWSEWRDGRVATRQDKFRAVMYYSRNDAWLPLE